MKNLAQITFIFFILNFLNIAKSEIIEGFCLVKRSDLEIAKIASDDFPRFLGKEIKILVSLDEGLLADISDDVDLSLITGMYGGSLEFKKDGTNYWRVRSGKFNSIKKAKKRKNNLSKVLKIDIKDLWAVEVK